MPFCKFPNWNKWTIHRILYGFPEDCAVISLNKYCVCYLLLTYLRYVQCLRLPCFILPKSVTAICLYID